MKIHQAKNITLTIQSGTPAEEIMTLSWAIVVRANGRQTNTPRLLYATLGATDCIGHAVI
jgi:hypothetical protein